MKQYDMATCLAICHAVGIQGKEEIQRLLEIEADIECFTFSDAEVEKIEVRL